MTWPTLCEAPPSAMDEHASITLPITVVMPTIPTRKWMMDRAIASVWAQTVKPRNIQLELDTKRTGSAATRNRALERAQQPWVAFLDDDDEFLPWHLEVSWRGTDEADVIYTGCEVVLADGTYLPHDHHAAEWGNFGVPFQPDMLRQRSCLPVTSLVRTEMAQAARFGPPNGVETPYDDWGFYLRLLDAGAQFLHIPERTWLWHHHGANTSGQPDRW